MTSAINCEKKKNAIPPPIIAVQATICLILDILGDSPNSLLNLIEFI